MTQEMVVWDAHRDVAYELPIEERFLTRNFIGVDLHLNRLQAGGINVQTFAICTAGSLGLQHTAQAIKELEQTLAQMDQHSDAICLVKNVGDALRVVEEGKIAAFLNLEGAEPILDQIELLRFFYRSGVRAMGLTWNYRNDVADGGYEDHTTGRLSNFGVKVVQEMNRLGMVVDLAHLTTSAMRQTIALSEQPVIHSHGGVKAINPTHPRAVPDDVLEAIAAKGGLFCVTSVPQAIDFTGKRANLERMIDAIEHCVAVMGDEHVGLGADFDVYQSHIPHYALGAWTEGLEEADKWQQIPKALRARGHSEERVARIMGQNLVRLYRQVVG